MVNLARAVTVVILDEAKLGKEFSRHFQRLVDYMWSPEQKVRCGRIVPSDGSEDVLLEQRVFVSAPPFVRVRAVCSARALDARAVRCERA